MQYILKLRYAYSKEFSFTKFSWSANNFNKLVTNIMGKSAKIFNPGFTDDKKSGQSEKVKDL